MLRQLQMFPRGNGNNPESCPESPFSNKATSSKFDALTTPRLNPNDETFSIVPRSLIDTSNGSSKATDILQAINQPDSPIHVPPILGRPSLEDFDRAMRGEIVSGPEMLRPPNEVEIFINTNVPIILIPWGDFHIGAEDFQYQLWRKHLALIANCPIAYVGIGGDPVEMFKKGKDQNRATMTTSEQRDLFLAALDEIGPDKALWFLKGHHETWPEELGGDFYKGIDIEYNAHILEGTARIRLNIGQIQYSIVTAHRLGRKPGLEQIRREIAGADIYISHHWHEKMVEEDTTRTFDGVQKQIYVVSGAYKTQDHYSNRNGFTPLELDELGPPGIVLRPDKKGIQAFSNLEAALTMARGGMVEMILAQNEIPQAS